MRLGIKLPPKGKVPIKTPVGSGCSSPSGPFVSVNRSYSETHFIVISIHCLAEADVVEWRSSTLPSGVDVLNFGAISTTDHALWIHCGGVHPTFTIGATVNGVDIGSVEVSI